MAVVEQTKFFVNFTEGLNTDFSKLIFPENAATDLDNIDIFSTGEVKRRLGVDLEPGYSIDQANISSSTLSTMALATHEWKAVNGRGDLNFQVIQFGSTLRIHDLSNEAISGSLIGTVSLVAFATRLADIDFTVMDIAFGEGVMLVASSAMETVLVEYNEESGTFSRAPVELRIRDFEGVDEGDLRKDERPFILSNEHLYSLLNRGWPFIADVSQDQDGTNAVFNQSPISYTESVIGQYPSNADRFNLAKLGATDDPEALGLYYPRQLTKQFFGNTPAPQGHFIINPYSVDRATTANAENPVAALFPGFPGVLVVQDLGVQSIIDRPTTVAFYAGRAFYAGIPNIAYNGDVFFSQSLTDTKNIGKCYQEHDPTAEEINNLLATDGGRVHIAGMGRVFKMLPVGQDLVMVAANGVWAISGTSGGNFTAEDFTVRKLTDIGTTSSETVLEVEGQLVWWNKGGIYQMASGQISDVFEVTRISKDKIETFYNLIPEAGKAYARGYYDDFQKQVYWLYNDDPGYDGINLRFNYTKALKLDLATRSFTTYSFGLLSENTPLIASMSQKLAESSTTVTFDVLREGDDVVQGGTPDDVVEDIAFPSFGTIRLKLFTLVEGTDGLWDYSFSEFNNTTFHDHTTWDQVINFPSNLGANYSSFLQAGWQTIGDPIRSKKITHLTSWFNVTESGYTGTADNPIFTDPSAATIQTRWEWTDLDNGRWTTPTEAYRLNRFYIPEDDTDPFDYGFEVVRTQLRMRGKGHSFSVRYESEEGKDFQLLGFAVNVKAPANI